MIRRRPTRPRTAPAAPTARPDANPGAEELVTEVYERHAAAIAAYAMRRTAAADAADVVADTFLVAWRRYDELPPEPNTLPWLYGVARRVVSNQRRSRDRRSRLHDRLRQGFVEFEQQADRVEHAEEFERVARALEQLGDDDAELLRLTAWEGLGPAEIATVMELESGVVRQRLRRARMRLRQHLDATVPVDAAVAWGPSANVPTSRFAPNWSTGSEG